jgi:hypothetical protein
MPLPLDAAAATPLLSSTVAVVLAGSGASAKVSTEAASRYQALLRAAGTVLGVSTVAFALEGCHQIPRLLLASIQPSMRVIQQHGVNPACARAISMA